MDLRTLQSILTIGETIAVEFKRCGNGIESDTYETVCSFLNRFGGDLFMGVLDDGTVAGVPEKAAPDMVKNFIKVVSNPALFTPTVYLFPEIIKYDETHTIIHVHIPPSAEVHSYKKNIYDRVDDADVKVNETGNADKVPDSADKVPINADKMPESVLSTQQKSVYQFVAENGQITSHQAEALLGVKQRRARTILGEMVDQGVLERQGAFKSTIYVLKERR